MALFTALVTERKMSKLLMSSLLEISIKGLNVERVVFPVLIESCAYDIHRENFDFITCKVTSKSYKNIKQKLKNYEIKIIDRFGLCYLPYFLLKNIGIFAGVFICLVMNFAMSFFTFNIKVVGDSNLYNDVYTVLNEQNVDISKATNDEIKDVIENNLENVSLVSVAKKGTTLVISIKEKTILDTQFVPIYAPDNMMITSIKVLQGTPVVKVGDIVKKGDILVEPYITSGDNSQMSVQPNAEIYADVWYSGVVKYQDIEKVSIRSGKKQVLCEYFMFGKKIYSNNTKCTFDVFEQECTQSYLTNMFIPIYMKKTTYYECVEKEIEHNYEQEYDSLVKESQSLAYAQNTTNEEILDENLDIIDIYDVKYIRTTIKINKKV